MTKRAAIYARVSGDDRKYATSGIESQLNDCRRYAESKSYHIVGEFFETPERQTSGAVWLPELERIIKLAKEGAFDVVVVREIDRLARNRFKQLSVEIELQSNGVAVEYVIGQFEDSAEGRLLKGLMSEFAEYEREKIKQRTVRGIIRSVKNGNVKIGGGNAPFGYDIEKIGERRTLVINETEAATVRLIFDLFVNQGYAINAVRQYLNDHKTPKPGKGNAHKAMARKTPMPGWSLGTLSNLLKNETYVGRWFYRKTKLIKDPRTGATRRVKQPRSQWLMVDVPAILSEELFQAAQERLTSNKRRRGKQHKHFYALGGMLQCGLCKNGVSGITRSEGYQYYVCNAHHNAKRYGIKCDSVPYKASEVDTAVWDWIKSILLSPERLHAYLKRYQDTQLESARPLIEMIQANEAEFARLRDESDRLIKAYTAGVLTLDDLAPQKADLDKRTKDVSEAIDMLKAELKPRMLSQDEIATIEKRAARVREQIVLTDDDPTTQRELFQLLEVQVVLSVVDGARWAEITCLFGESRLSTDYSTAPCSETGAAARWIRPP